MPALVNKEKKYVFVHIPKTAGGSICEKLIKDGAMRALHEVHPTSTRLCEKYSPDEFFYFTFVRNPWDRIYSLYNFTEFKYHKRTKSKTPRFQSFEHFILEGFSNDWHYVQSPKFPQTYWILIENKIVPKFIGKFETLTDDLKILSKHIDVSFDNLDHVHKSFRLSNYQEAYNKKGKNLIKQYHISDIELFDYIF